MKKKNLVSLVLISILGAGVYTLIAGEAAATSPSSRKSEGTFIITVTAGESTFQELLTLHEGGTISETNTTIHANSASEFFPFNGSDGYGAWERGFGGTVVLKFVKLLFDGETNAHVGYLVVDATAIIDGDDFTNLESDVNILIGPDLFDPLEIIPLGPTEAVGKRITVE